MTTPVKKYEALVALDCTVSWHLRAGVVTTGTKNEIKEVVESLNPIRYIIAREVSKKGVEHYHVVLELKPEIGRDKILKPFKEKFPNMLGNKSYSLKLSKERVNVIKYVVKEDEEVIVFGYNKEFIQHCTDVSYTPKNKDKFVQLKTEYMDSDMTIEEYVEKLIDIKVECDQPLYVSHLEAHIRMMACKKDDREKKRLSSHILNKVLYDLR